MYSPSDYRIFSALPVPSAVVLPDSPIFTVIASTQEFAAFAGAPVEELIGKSLFNYFPDNPEAPVVSSDIRASLAKCIATKNKNELGAQRYDIDLGDGKFTEMYWTVIHSPILDIHGEITGIIHTALNVTDHFASKKKDDRIKTLEPAHNLFMQSSVAIHILKGDNLVIELANEPTLRLWDKDQSVVGKPILETLPELASQPYLNMLQQVISSGKSIKSYDEPININRNGKPFTGYYNFVLQPYYDNNEKIPVGIVVMMNEVTEIYNDRRELAEKEKSLIESEDRYRTLIEESPVATALYIGRELKIMYANNIMTGYWGKGTDVIGKTLSEILPELDGQPFLKYLDDVFTTGIAYEGIQEKATLLYDGKLQDFYFDFTYKALRDAEGEIYGIHHISVDVTMAVLSRVGLVESERNFRSMILSAPVAMCILQGENHVFANVNAMMEELLGRKASEIEGKSLFDAMPEIRDEGLQGGLSDVILKGTSFISDEQEFNLPRNGTAETVYVRYIYEPMKDAAGEIEGIMVVATDVTPQVLARRKIEDIVAKRTSELAEANQRLQSSNAELEQFAYIASHDLQEPLRKISMFTQMLEKSLGTVDERSMAQMNRINNSVSRMANLIRDILGYSQLSRKHDRFQMTNLEAVFNEAISDFDLILEEKNGRIYHTGLPTIHAIPLQMTQLFHNMISNALKYSRPDVAPEIIISSRKLSVEKMALHDLQVHGPGYYEIDFSDNGIGFAPEYADRIFQIFQRLHGKSEYEGTGIGLAMCRKIAENHKGLIFAAGTPGKGAVFTVILPLR